MHTLREYTATAIMLLVTATTFTVSYCYMNAFPLNVSNCPIVPMTIASQLTPVLYLSLSPPLAILCKFYSNSHLLLDQRNYG